MTKCDHYSALADALVTSWQHDGQIMETDPDTWTLVRTIDDWLVTYRTDDRVGVEQYARNIARLREIYISVSRQEAL